MSTLNIAIIGAGGITLQNHLPGLALCPNVRVHALCDANPATLEAARTQTGAPVAETSWEKVVTRDDVHAVIIATPNFLHPDIAITAARHGKHVLCEKPLALNATDAQRMADEADRAGVRHMTAFTYRFVPAMRYLRYLIDQGSWGRRITTDVCGSRTGAPATWGGDRSGSSRARGRSGTCSVTGSTLHTIWWDQ